MAEGTQSGIRIAMVGDLMVGDSAVAAGYGFASSWVPSQINELVAVGSRIFSDADIVIGNLESVLDRRDNHLGDWHEVQMRGWPEYATMLARLGFTHLSLANNHAMQHGREAFRDTVRRLEENGIAVIGLAGADGWCCKPVIVYSPNGTAVLGLLAYSLRPRQYRPNEVPLYAEGTRESIISDIKRFQNQVQNILVSLHWGEEYVQWPSEEEVDFARELADAGVKVIHGHHPHVLRPVELYSNSIIAYSLGNFFSDMIYLREFRDTAILKINVDVCLTARMDCYRIGKDYLPSSVCRKLKCGIENRVEGLKPDSYRKAVKRSLFRHRYAAYAHVIRNLARFDRQVLVQIILTTFRRRLESFAAHFDFFERR